MKQLLTTVFSVWAYLVCAQTVTFNGVGNLPIPPGAPGQTIGVTQSSCSVTGVGVLGGCATIDNVTIDLLHSWVGDIGILLIGPGGQVLELSTSNGGPGDNYTNTVFSDNAGAFITTGSPPFTGNFRPEGRVTNLNAPYSNAPALGTYTFANTYNGLNADGDWILYINDYVAADVGLLISWSITFNVGGVPPVADAGPDVVICPGQTTTLTATGGGSYQWSNGANTSSTNVNPSTTTTYTVTVTAPGCGTDTDDVLVTVEPISATVTPGSPYICPGTSVTLDATPGFSSYNWSNGLSGPGISVTQAGNYTVTVTNAAGCTATATLNLPSRPNPGLSLSVANSNVCAENCSDIQVNLTGTPPFQFSWQFQSGGAAVGGNQVVNASSNTVTFQACPPSGVTGPLQVVVCTLSDAFCTN